jgi:uncharacterized protein (DUF1697 family)
MNLCFKVLNVEIEQSSPRYVALLRAINVGGHVVKMDRLRALFTELGFERVETFIASGNVIFDPPTTDAAALENTIERHLEGALGYPVATFLRSTTELAAIATRQPFPKPDPDADGATLFVGFLRSSPPGEVQQRLLAMQSEVDAFHFHDRELYWLRRASIRESKFGGPLLEKTLQQQTTIRNISTVRKLAAKFAHP